VSHLVTSDEGTLHQRVQRPPRHISRSRTAIFPGGVGERLHRAY
jgi:hypothetical protein